MSALLNSAWLLAVVRLVVGATFVRMGLSKVADPVAFLKLIREYELVPEGLPWLMNTMAVGIPWIEVCGGVLLLLGVAVRGVSLGLAVMLVVFSGAIGLRALGIQESDGVAFCSIVFDCGCGSGEVNVCGKLAENAGLLLASLLALASRSTRWCLAPSPFATPEA